MAFYAFGSILFVVAMVSAFVVMASDFAHYRRAMMVALRGLTLDGLDVRPSATGKPQVTPAEVRPVRLWPQAAA